MPYQPQQAMPAMPAPLPSPFSPRRGQAPARAPVVRGQAPAETSAPLKVPTPEELGIRLGAAAPEAPLDWNQLRRKLDELGATGFRLDRQGAGFRFVCLLPAGDLEGAGTTEAEAVRVALAKARK
jgi:hypothetical protein